MQVISHRYKPKVSLFHTHNHFDLLLSKSRYENLSLCQNIIYGILHEAFDIPEFQSVFQNLDYQEQLDAIDQEEGSKRPSRRHKKSYSDCLNSVYQDQDFNMFKNPPADFLNHLDQPNPT